MECEVCPTLVHRKIFQLCLTDYTYACTLKTDSVSSFVVSVVLFLICVVLIKEISMKQFYKTHADKVSVTFSCILNVCPEPYLFVCVLNVFIDIQTSKELIQMDTDKMMTHETFTMDEEKLTQS